MTDYATIFGTLGAEFKNQRKVEAVYEHFHFVDNSNYSKRLVEAQYDPTSIYEEVALNRDSSAYEQNVAETCRGFVAALKQVFEGSWFPVLDGIITTNPADKQVGGISYVYDPTLTDGTVAILTRQGRWAALRAQMIADNTKIKKNGLSFGSITAVGENYGTLTLDSISGLDHCLSGVLTFICIDDTVGAQKFTVQNVLTKKLPDPAIPSSTDGLFSILSADNQLTLGKAWQDGPLGLSVQLSQGSPTEVDPDNLLSSINVPYSGESDTNKGIIYIRFTRQADDPVWLIQWFRDAALTELVTQTSVSGTVGTVVISMSGTATNFQATFDKANADSAMPGVGDTSDFSLNLNVPRLNDQWTIAVTNDEAGNFATKLAHLYRASLNSAGAAPVLGVTGALAGAGAGNVDDGDHSYSYTWVTNGVETGESFVSNTVTVVDKTVNGKVSLTGILAGPSGTTARKLYRTEAAGSTRKYLATISDNVTTTYLDNIADASLGDDAPTEISDGQATSVSMT